MSRLGALFEEICRPALEEHLAETVVRYPLGVQAHAVNVTAIVNRAAEIGTNEVSGDGVVLDDRYGERVRRSYTLDLAASVAVDLRDTWLIGGEKWFTRRVIGRDQSTQTVLIVRNEGGRTVQPRLQRG